MNSRKLKAGEPVFNTTEHEGKEALRELFLELLVFYINQQAGRILVKEINKDELPIWPEGVAVQ